jgi:selenocysteine lyase/cysteine desulfurase
MTGTQSHEAIHSAAACVDYLASLAGACGDSRSDRLNAAFAAIQTHETELGDQLLCGLRDLPDFRLWGINDSARWNERVPTFSVTHDRLQPQQMAIALAEQGLYGWAGNHYALPLTERLKLEPHGTLRLGLLHYNTRDEVGRLLSALRSLSE